VDIFRKQLKQDLEIDGLALKQSIYNNIEYDDGCCWYGPFNFEWRITDCLSTQNAHINTIKKE